VTLPLWLRVRLETRGQVKAVRARHAANITSREERPRLSMHVSNHALIQAQARYGADVAAFDVLEDVVRAMREKRTGPKAPGGYAIRGDRAFAAWTADLSRLYVVKRATIGLVIVTSLPPTDDRWRTRIDRRAMHRHGDTAVGRALAEAQERRP
jgi:hypothetical protein